MRPCSFPTRSWRRNFHDYFVTHLPQSSLHPDSNHKLPRDVAAPHDKPSGRQPATLSPIRRDTTVVRIPLKSAKHHYGATCLRGGRPYNEDTHQAGTIEIPAFAKRQPVSLTRANKTLQENNAAAASENGDPQVFYFGVFDGHGGTQCSEFLRDRLHSYLEKSAIEFHMESSLQDKKESDDGHKQLLDLQRNLVNSWKDTVGGYFRRFRPDYFSIFKPTASTDEQPTAINSIQATLMYAFLHADMDFTAAQASKHSPSLPASTDDPVLTDRPLNDNDILSSPARPASQNLSNVLRRPIGGHTRFQGGSTASIALISTPTPTPFWNPASPATIVTAHCGDTRILLCRVSDGKAVPLTTNHHPSTPVEATRLRRFAATFVTDSFGEERILGLANTRSFGDISSKRIGVSAEPEIRLLHMEPSEYSFLILISDGVTASLEDQEIVDIVKEAKTPESAARVLATFATEVGGVRSDNATAIVVRLGGWERRMEGGGGSVGTKEVRDWKKSRADDPRSSRQ
ncbi:protein serine/threonine phosphatase 2C [Aureobasidium sp. EXF-8845]|nr:protein serine/threonine phosphatase 2C [Aureobasidium sp. EXF-8845]